MNVRAAVLDQVGGPLQVQELDLAGPREGEVLVRMLAVGVCHSDWHVVTGDTKHPLPVVLGHEGAGVVEAVNPIPDTRDPILAPGDLVALNWAPSCGSCFYCTHGRPALCGTYVGPVWAGTMLDGTTRYSRRGEPVYHYSALACFADHIVVPKVCCVKMPAMLSPEVAAVIGCAVTTGVGSVLNTAKVVEGSSALVIGAGGVGLSTVIGLGFVGASPIIVADPLETRLAAARDLGAHHSLERAEPERVKSLTESRGADYVFECVGTPALQEIAVQCARPGGTVVFSGLSPSGTSTNIPGSRLVREEKTVMGSYYGTSHPARDFVKFAELHRKGDIDLAQLVSHRYTLDQINEAYADMLGGKSTRGVVVFQ